MPCPAHEMSEAFVPGSWLGMHFGLRKGLGRGQKTASADLNVCVRRSIVYTIQVVLHRTVIGAIAIAGPIFLGACGPIYEYTPPESPEGRVCVAQCSNNKSYCEQVVQSRYGECQARYNLAQQQYQSCKAAGGSFCSSPSYCLGPTPSTATRSSGPVSRLVGERSARSRRTRRLGAGRRRCQEVDFGSALDL